MMLLGAPRFILRSLAPGCSNVSRRHLSTVKPSKQLRFSYFPSSNDKPHEILGKLRDKAYFKNPNRHNAAIVLASPHFVEHLDDSSFNSELVNILSAGEDTKDFHLLCAIVDAIAPALSDPISLPGISVLRGELDSLLPQLWKPDSPVDKFERDSVAALTFKVGLSSHTLPLTRTTFLNNKTSTLLVSRHDLSGGSPREEERIEKTWQQVYVQVNALARSVADFDLWAPLSPVTPPRKITASFGNIVRSIEVDGVSIPASTELEAAVNSIIEHEKKAETTAGPVGVWALITPEQSQTNAWKAELAPRSSAIVEGNAAIRADLYSCVEYLQRQHQTGSRFYQVLSGGGGWGPKKGLLSLDPRETYFASSEEEEMEKFVRTMSNSSFAPSGAHIQFFVPAPASPSGAHGVVFGVPSNPEPTRGLDRPKERYLARDHFGALSTQGIYSSMPLNTDIGSNYDSKLSVPGSTIYINDLEARERS